MVLLMRYVSSPCVLQWNADNPKVVDVAFVTSDAMLYEMSSLPPHHGAGALGGGGGGGVLFCWLP